MKRRGAFTYWIKLGSFCAYIFISDVCECLKGISDNIANEKEKDKEKGKNNCRDYRRSLRREILKMFMEII